MKPSLSKVAVSNEQSKRRFLLREAAFFLAFFLVAWLRIRPELAFQRQQPVFLTGADFFREFLSRPGGPVEYISALISQGLYFPIPGAAIVTGLAWGVSRLTAIIIRGLVPGRKAGVVHLIPAVLLLGLHNHYAHPLTADTGLLLALLFTAGYARLRAGPLWRLACFVASGAVLYYMSAGWFLLYGLLTCLIETIHAKQPLLGIATAAFSAAVPFVSRFFFLIGTEAAYLSLLPFGEACRPRITPYLLVGFFPLMIPLLHERISGLFQPRKMPGLNRSGTRFILQTAVLMLAFGLAVLLPFERNNRLLLLVDREARLKHWDGLLRLSSTEADPPLPVTFQTNRALFHKGRLLDDLFSFPQRFGVSGLMLPRKFSESAPLQESDFCFDLGSINESRHWAYEAAATDGETAWVLRRLAEVNLVSGNTRAAERCLNRLDRALFLGQDGRRLRACIHDSALAHADETLRHGTSLLGKTDYIAFNGHPRTELDSLMRENPGNRMAFEYRVAHDLLSMRLGNLASYAGNVRSLGYTKIPRHLEEAFLFTWAMSRKREPTPELRLVGAETMRRFGEFNRAAAKYRGDVKASLPEMSGRFGDTFWFYALTHRPNRRDAAQAPAGKGGSR